VWVVCQVCELKAIAKADHTNKTARLFCSVCGYNKQGVPCWIKMLYW
jgi:hypothetical protein